MTAPDVAALAAALHGDKSPQHRERYPDVGGHDVCDLDAEAIIAALAAQGWRMASDPVFWDERAHEVSAQAAPGFATGGNDDAPSTRTQAAPATADDIPWAGDSAEQAAVRATLEGLRAEVEDTDFDGLNNLGVQMRIAAIIDALLAALDA